MLEPSIPPQRGYGKLTPTVAAGLAQADSDYWAASVDVQQRAGAIDKVIMSTIGQQASICRFN